jgi:hypothetical protein
MLSACAAAALGCTALAWLQSGMPGQSFVDYVLDLGQRDWRVLNAGHPVLAHADSFGVAAVGRHWDPADHHLAIGALILGGFGLATFFLRGDARPSRFILACAIAIAARIPFFIWFEPHNPEWHVLNLVLIAAACASRTAAAPRSSAIERVLGTAILICMAVAFLAAHGKNTLRLRERNLISAVTALGDTSGVDVYVEGHRVGSAFSLLQRRRTVLETSRQANETFLFNEVAIRPRPMLFVIDRMVQDGSPDALAHLSEYDHHFDLRPDTEDLRFERWQGLVYAIRYTPHSTTRQSK